MLVTLSRSTKKTESAWIAVEGKTVIISDDLQRGNVTRRNTLKTEAQAYAEMDRFVARRTKAGWQVRDRIETPWIAWVEMLETQLWSRVIEDARESGVGVSEPKAVLPGAMMSYFIHGRPSDDPMESAPAEYANFSCVAHPGLRFVLGDGNLSFDILFRLGDLDDWDLGSCFWQRLDNNVVSDYGVFEGGILESHVGDDVIRHESADAFRGWFPKYVRDDVMSFTIAELAPR